MIRKLLGGVGPPTTQKVENAQWEREPRICLKEEKKNKSLMRNALL
jgi:hypothetical protein